MPFPCVYTIHVAHSQSFFFFLRFSSHACAELVGMKEPPVWQMFDTSQSSGTPGWIKSGQINAITQVSGEMGTKGHSLSAFLLEILARLEHQVCFCMEWQTADWPHECYIALRCPQMPHKEPRQKCLANLTTLNVMNASGRVLRRVHNNRV